MLNSLRWLSYIANQEGFYKNPIQLKLINMGHGTLKSIQIMPKAVIWLLWSVWALDNLNIFWNIIGMSSTSQPLENSVLNEKQNFGIISYKWQKSA